MMWVINFWTQLHAMLRDWVCKVYWLQSLKRIFFLYKKTFDSLLVDIIRTNNVALNTPENMYNEETKDGGEMAGFNSETVL